MPAFLAHKQLLALKQPVWLSGMTLSLAVGLLFYLAAAQSIEHEARERFKSQAQSAQYSIASGIRAYTNLLRGGASFFQATGTVTRSQFHHYVQGLGLRQHFPAIDNINFTEYVKDQDRAAFERAMASRASADDNYPPFAITPSGRRADYSVITLIEPTTAPFIDRLGIDIAARPAVASAIAHGRDTGTLSTSGQPIGFLSHPGLAGMGMRLPIYRHDAPLNTVAQRRAAYLGSLGVGFSVARLVGGALNEMPARNVRLRLYDGGETATAGSGTDLSRQVKDVLLYDSLTPTDMHERPAEVFSVVLPIDFNGRLWKAYFSSPKQNLYSHIDAYLPWLAMLTGFIGSMLIYVLFHTMSSSRLRAIKMAKAMTKELRDSQAKLQLSHHKLRRLAAHADQIKEQERKRIAREIHDDLGQSLLVLRIEADMLASRTRQRHPRLYARAHSTLGQIDSTIKSVRHIINDLRPNVLDLGLSAAVEWQIAQFRQRSGMVCELIEDPHDIVIDDHCATALFRVLQESLSNVQQHARASLVRVELRQHGGMLRMTISDNGIGLRASSRNKRGSFGLVGIEERISLLGGECSISGAPHLGTTVAVSVPVSYPARGFADPEQNTADALA